MKRERFHVSQQNMGPRWTALDSLLCGAFAGAVAKTVIAPLDRTKIIFQGKNPFFTLLLLSENCNAITQLSCTWAAQTLLRIRCVSVFTDCCNRSEQTTNPLSRCLAYMCTLTVSHVVLQCPRKDSQHRYVWVPVVRICDRSVTCVFACGCKK